jgi:hypothetical protein
MRRNSYYRVAKNPKGVVDALKSAIPFAASLYGSRFVTNKVGPMLPGVDALGTAAKPAVAGLVMLGAHFATKKVKVLKKHRGAIMVGAGINVLDCLLGAFAPESVKSMFGIAGEVPVAPEVEPTEGYFTTSDYYAVGDAPPLDDQLALQDYVSVGDDLYSDMGAEEDLGMLEQELGLEQDLGAADFADRRLGGVHRGQMLRPVKSASMLAPVPARSWTREVPEVGRGFDSHRSLYTGVFSGGW